LSLRENEEPSESRDVKVRELTARIYSHASQNPGNKLLGERGRAITCVALHDELIGKPIADESAIPAAVTASEGVASEE